VKRGEKRKWRAQRGPGSRVVEFANILASEDNGQCQAVTRALRDHNESHDWEIVVDDIDVCLHEFRYRNASRIPPIKLRTSRETSKLLHFEDFANKLGVDTGGEATVVSDFTEEESGQPSDFATTFQSLPNAPTNLMERGSFSSAELRIGDTVDVGLNGKKLRGSVLQKECELNAAFLSYEGYPSEYDEFQPYERLRVPVGGEGVAEVLPDDVKPGAVVLNRWGAKSEEYRATVQYTTVQPFLLVGIDLGSFHIERWIPLDFVSKPNNI